MSKENQIEDKAESKKTVSMTVVISKESREKLRDVKGILGCRTLDGAVNAAMGVISLKELLSIRLEKEKLKEIESKVLPTNDQILSTNDQKSIPDEEMNMADTMKSLYGEEEIAMVAFCIELKKKLGYDDIGQIDALIEDGTIKIIDTTKPRISQVGEIPYDIE